MEASVIKKLELQIINTVKIEFEKGTKLHYKWYGLTKDILMQYGTFEALVKSSPDEIMFEVYSDHERLPKVIVKFFDKDFNAIQNLTFTTGWKLGSRISNNKNDKNYEMTDPVGNLRLLELNTNLYSKAYKSVFSKYIKYKSFNEIK